MKSLINAALPALVLVAGWISLTGCSSESSKSPPTTKVVVTNTTNPPPLAPAPPPATVAAPTAAPTARVAPERIPLPPAVDAVVDLAHSQVGESVLLEYIKHSTNTYELSADQLIYLKDIGLSDPVLTAMVQRSQELRQTGGTATASVVATPAPAPLPAPGPDLAAAPAAAAAPVYANAVSAPEAAAPAPAAQPVYAQPVTQVNYNYFYSALSPYGSWVEMPNYGWCWQPTCAVVDPSWRPYCHGGRWLNTDSGWYWQSSYSWGWAPFHYGNWYRSPACGWVWMPGYTWAPSWVTWRYTDAYCGWAPLPPGCGWNVGVGLTYWGSGISVGFGFGLGWDCFNFVSYRGFCDPHPYRHCLPHAQVVNVYNNSTVINNYGNANNTVVNHGIAPTKITAVTRSEIRKVSLRDVTAEPNAPRRADQLERNGTELAVYRPQPTSNPHTAPQPTSRHSQEVRRDVAPASPGTRGLAETNPRVAAPVTPGRVTKSELAPATPAPAGTLTRSGVSRNEVAPSRSATTPSPRATAPAGQVPSAVPAAPVSNPATRLSRVASEPVKPAASNVPQRADSVPANRAPTPAGTTPTTPTTLSRSAARPAPAASTDRQPARNPSAPAPAAPSYGPPGTTAATTPRSSREASAPARTEMPRSEPRKLEAATPSYVTPPKYANSAPSAPVYGAGNPPVSVSAPSRSVGSGAPNAPVYQAPRSSAPAPSYNAPARPNSGAPAAPAYSAPPRPSTSAPPPPASAPAAPSSGGGTRGGGRTQPN